MVGEVAGRHQPHQRVDGRGDVERPALGHEAVAAAALQRRRGDQRRRPRRRASLAAAPRSARTRGSPAPASRSRPRAARPARRRTPRGSKPGSTPLSAIGAPDQQAGAGEQHQRERDLRHDQHVAQPVAAARREPVRPPSFSASCGSRPAMRSAGARPKTSPLSRVSPQREGQHRPVHPRLRQPGHVLRAERGEQRPRPSSPRACRARPPAAGEHQALGQRLAQEVPAARADRGANRHLARARRAAGEQQVGDVGAGDEQHEARRRRAARRAGGGSRRPAPP